MENNELPRFLYEDNGKIRIGYKGDTDITEIWNDWLKNIPIKEAVASLNQQLKDDPDYYRSWKDNIAMAFKDEYNKHYKILTPPDLHEIANNAAENFLNLLIQE